METTIKTQVKKQIHEFIDGLKERYTAAASDRFLTEYLIREFEEKYRFARQRNEVINYVQVAYDSSVYLFETLLEYGCELGGNGHHTAQRFAELFKDFNYIGNFNDTITPNQ